VHEPHGRLERLEPVKLHRARSNRLLKKSTVILRSEATKNLLLRMLNSTPQQILRCAQDDKE